MCLCVIATLINTCYSLHIQEMNTSGCQLEVTEAFVEEHLSDTVAKHGPIPRTVYAAAATPVRHESALNKALQNLTYDKLIDAIEGATSDSRAVSHQIVLIKRHPRLTTELDDDAISLDFISDHVASEVMQRLRNLEFHQATTLLSLFQASPETSTAGGWLFEALAHQVLTLNVHPSDWMPLPPLRRMEPTQGTLMKFSVMIPANADIDGANLYLPIRKESREFYDDIIKVPHPADGKYLIPRERNNPLFDSLLFGMDLVTSGPGLAELGTPEPNPKRQKIEAKTVYVLQMIKSHDRKDSEKGLHDLTRLKAAIPDITFVFVVVVPQTRRERTVIWEMPEGWASIRGPVYCQELVSLTRIHLS